MLSDVPVGTFLSGGIDSSLVTSIASKVSKSKIKTFTVGFKDHAYDETAKARKISEYLKTDHYELLFTEKEIKDTIESLHYIYSDPFADSSQIPTILLSKFAKEKITVALTGDGGDELFGGYNRYLWINKLFKIFNTLGQTNSLLITKMLNLLLYNNKLSKTILNYLGNFFNVAQPRDKIIKLIKIIKNSYDYDFFYQSILKTNNESDSIFTDIEKKKIISSINDDHDIENIYLQDFNDYLPNDILCKVDRASMSQSLETRIPLLAENIIDFSCKLSQNLKINNKENKFLLKKILENYLPKNLIYSPKIGFGVPLNFWFNTFLFKWLEDLFDNHKFDEQYGLNNESISILWSKFKKEKYGNEKLLWNIAILKKWDLNKCS